MNFKMIKKVEYLLACYNRVVVENIYTFETGDQLKDHLITLLQYPPIEDVENLALQEIISHINKRWNRIDANEWRLSYRIDKNGIARMI